MKTKILFIFIIMLISYNSLSNDDINIPDGIYNGHFFVGGHVNCNAWVEKNKSIKQFC